MIREFRRLGAARSGVVALEFALTCPLLLLLMLGVTDLGMAVWSQSCLNIAVAAGAEYAVRTQLGGTNVTKAQIQNIVQKATTLSGIDASTTTDPGWSCVVTTNGVVSLTSPTNGTTCADGTQAGRFVQVAATYNYSVIGAGMDFLGGQSGTISLAATMKVRLQ